MPDSKIKALLLDLSGTLYVDDEVIEGAVDLVRRCEAAGMPYLYVTNTTSKPRRRILERMAGMGFQIQAEQVFTAPIAAGQILGQKGCRRCHCLLKPEVLEDLPDVLAVDATPDAVVVGDIGTRFDYACLNQAFKFLMEGAAFYALASNRYFKSEGALQLDVGPFVAALEFATERKAELIGKPSAAFFRTAVQRLGIAPEEVAMVGDDLESDVGGAMAAGLHGILVQTGKYRAELLETSKVKPDATLRSIADLPHLLEMP